MLQTTDGASKVLLIALMLMCGVFSERTTIPRTRTSTNLNITPGINVVMAGDNRREKSPVLSVSMADQGLNMTVSACCTL